MHLNMWISEFTKEGRSLWSYSFNLSVANICYHFLDRKG